MPHSWRDVKRADIFLSMDKEERKETARTDRSKPENGPEPQQPELDRARPFLEAFGERLRAVREESKQTAGDIADTAKFLGLSWHRTTVGQVENGKRGLTAVELLVLPLIYEKPLRLLLPPEFTWLTSEVAGTQKGILQAVLGSREGHVGGTGPDTWHLKGGPLSLDDIARITHNAVESLAQGWPADVRDRPLKERVKPDETDQKAAARLGTTPEYVSFAAQETYGRSLAQERDARVNERDDIPTTKRGLQAVRGHVTRAILDELGPAIERYRQQDIDVEESD